MDLEFILLAIIAVSTGGLFIIRLAEIYQAGELHLVKRWRIWRRQREEK